jgi:DNA-binding GntR family transcriptional regulator
VENVTTDSTKADEIALELEREIVTGELAPGTVLRQEHLSERFAVSRTPVREALRQLAARGLVSFEPNRGVRVRTLSHDELYEAFLVRAELESLATALAAPKLTDADLAELEAAERRFAELTAQLLRPDGKNRQMLTRDWVGANHGFHDVIYRVAESPMVERLAKSARRTFSGHAVWGTGGSGIDELYEANVRQHQAIIEALRAGSAAAARLLAREHVLHSFHLLETVLAQVAAPKPTRRLRRSA